jgi:S1-C subfamily serine protease
MALKNYLLPLLFMVIFISCKSIKIPAIIDGSRADGTLTLVYEYSHYERPIVQWDVAKQSTISKCKSWGYFDAEFFELGTKECISRAPAGNCLAWQVTYKCQCISASPSNIQEESKQIIKSSGTGFAISTDGVIVTNYHVIEGGNEFKIKGIQKDFTKTYKLKILLEDKKNDLAILKIDDITFPGLPQIPYTIRANSADVGESVFVLGYPLRSTMGDEIKLTSGIISSKSGFQGDITSYQTTVPVQSGNSGGPMFDKSGNLIGIINAKHIGAENASYGIKVSYLNNLIESLPTSININKENKLAALALTEQTKSLSDFVFIIETK